MSADSVKILPKGEHRATIIWMHGLGADGHDFESIVPELKLSDNLGIHYLFPNAKIQPVTINGGMKMRAWYDIMEMSIDRKVDENGIYESVERINEIIEEEINKGIPPEKILLAGFSQGGVIALHSGIASSHKFAGIIGLSTYLPTIDSVISNKSNINTPIFMGHGSVDPVVQISLGQSVFKRLEQNNFTIEFNEYYMQHSLCPEEITDISTFINKVLS